MSSPIQARPPASSPGLGQYFAKPKEKTTEVIDAEWYIAKWKTQPCQFSVCPNSWGCPHAHGEDELRRSPVTYSYSPEACPDAPNCPRGDQCQYAHNYNEQAYHPSVYKTVACADFPWHCNQGSRCPNAHGYREIRSPTGTSNARTAPRRAISLNGMRSFSPSKLYERFPPDEPNPPREGGRVGDPRRAKRGGRFDPVVEGRPRDDYGESTEGPYTETEDEVAAGYVRKGQPGGYTWQQTPAQVRDVLAADLINRMMTQAGEETETDGGGDSPLRAPPLAKAMRTQDEIERVGGGFVRNQVRDLDTRSVDGNPRTHNRSASAMDASRSRRYNSPRGEIADDVRSISSTKGRSQTRTRDRKNLSQGSEAEWQYELASLLSRHPSRVTRGVKSLNSPAKDPKTRGKVPASPMSPVSRAAQLQAIVDAQKGDVDELLARTPSPAVRNRSPSTRMASPRRVVELKMEEVFPPPDVPRQRTKSSLGGDSPFREAGEGRKISPPHIGKLANESKAEDGGVDLKPGETDVLAEERKMAQILRDRLKEFDTFQNGGEERGNQSNPRVDKFVPPEGFKTNQDVLDSETIPQNKSPGSKSDGHGGEEIIKRPNMEQRRALSHSTDSGVFLREAPTEHVPEPPLPNEGQLEPGVLHTLLHSPAPEAGELQKKVKQICEEEGVELLWTPVGGDVTPKSVISSNTPGGDITPGRNSDYGSGGQLDPKSPLLAEKGKPLSPLPSQAPTPRFVSTPTLTGPRKAIAAAEEKIAALFQGVASTTARFPPQFLWYLEEGYGGKERLDLLREKHGVEFTISLPTDSLTVWLAGGVEHRKVMAYLRELGGAMGTPGQLAQIQEEPGENGTGGGEKKLEEVTEIPYPAEWEMSGLAAGKWHLVAVPEGTPEWSACLDKLRGSVPSSGVVRLLRFQSPRQWQRFSAERQAVGSSRWLFTACTKTEVQTICSGGFAASLTDPDSGEVVLGSLFTSEAWQALQFAPRTSDGLRILVAVEAALGDVWWERNLTLLTERVEGAVGGEKFDAIVDNQVNPQIHAIARRQQAYPAYVLEVGPDVETNLPDAHTSFTLEEPSQTPSEKAMLDDKEITNGHKDTSNDSDKGTVEIEIEESGAKKNMEASPEGGGKADPPKQQCCIIL